MVNKWQICSAEGIINDRLTSMLLKLFIRKSKSKVSKAIPVTGREDVEGLTLSRQSA
jgi:hypothetical protein